MSVNVAKKKAFFPYILIFYYIKQIDSMLSCVFSVIDHRGRQNVVRTSVTRSAAPRAPFFCSYHILTSSAIYLINRFHVAVRLFSNRSQMTSKCGKNKKVAHEAQPSVSLMFLPHFDVLCDLLLNRRTARWNLFVLYNKKIKIHGKNALLFQISPL